MAERGISPSRRSLQVVYPAGEAFRSDILNTQTFAVVASWEEDHTSFHNIADHRLVGYCGLLKQICIRRTDQDWRPFQPTGLKDRLNDPQRASTSFVNDGTVVMKAWNQMAVIAVDGSLLSQVELPKNQSFGEIVASSGGERFAVIVNRQRGLTIETLDMYAFSSNDRVVVYSIPDRRTIYAVKVKGTSPWAPWAPHRNHASLSPDGTLLAIESDGVLRVYRLPDTNK